MKTLLLLSSFILVILGYSQEETVFEYTGAVQTYVVPPGVSSIQVEAWGAEGGGSQNCSSTIEADGGLGGYAVGQLSVTVGETIYIYVGEHPETTLGGDSPGGFNGGGTAGQYGGPGGGASDVRQGGSTLADRVIVAGGGGGGNTGCPDHGTGGAGGGLIGNDGLNLSGGYAPGGGGGIGSGGAAGASPGTAGSLGVGGSGGSLYHIAGGGGGYYGGGGAYAAGGGGGSSYLGGVDDGETTAGVRSGHGEVVITVLCTALSLTVSDYDLCIGQYLTLEAASETGGITSWDGDVVDGEPFLPGSPGEYSYIVSSTSPDDCTVEVEVIVHENPPVVANAAPSEVCEGDALLLYGSGADIYEWDPGYVTDGEVIYPEAGTMIYTVIGMDEFGCVALDEVEVEIYAAPEVSISTESTKACVGGEITLSGTGAFSYDWSDGIEDGEPFIATETGVFTYEVTGESEIGCEGEASIEITVNEPIEITYTTTEELFGGDGEIDITVTGGFTPYSYDWDNDGTGDFDDSEDLTGISGGTYIVVVESDGNCSSSDTMSVGTQLSIADEGKIALDIYPNPTSDVLQINADGFYNYALYALDGKLILQGNATNNTTLSLESIANGTYLLKLKQGETNQLFKVVKQ
jgi:hypothetical protein